MIEVAGPGAFRLIYSPFSGKTPLRLRGEICSEGFEDYWERSQFYSERCEDYWERFEDYSQASQVYSERCAVYSKRSEDH